MEEKAIAVRFGDCSRLLSLRFYSASDLPDGWMDNQIKVYAFFLFYSSQLSASVKKVQFEKTKTKEMPFSEHRMWRSIESL